MAVIDGAAASETLAGNATPSAGRTWSISTFLFRNLGAPAVDRAARMSIVGKGASADIAVDADGNVGNGQDVIVGS
jgi:hypothetical protein